MRKLFVSLLAVAALAACSNEDVVRQPESNAIRFDGMFVENATRAEDPSLTKDNLTAFDVWGFMNETTAEVFNGTDVTRMGDMWYYDVPQYWLKGNTYYFAALAPMNSQNVALTVASGEAAKLGLGKIAFTNVDGSEDLIYASTSVKAEHSGNEAVKFTFNHLLSKIKFTFINGFAHDNITVDVENVTMVAPKSGTIDLAVENWWDNNDWVLADETLTLEFGNTARMYTYESESESEPKYTSATAAKERLTIPTDAAYAHEVTFTANVYVGDQKTAFEKTAVIEGAAFEMGKAYNLVATISPETLDLEEIVFEVVEVKEWIEQDMNCGEFGDNTVFVSTIDELQAALNAAKGDTTVSLGADLKGNVTVPELADATISINGNGYEFDGTFALVGGSTYGEGTTVFNNIKFKSAGLNGYDAFIYCNDKDGHNRYPDNVTIKNCTFNGTDAAVAAKFRSLNGNLVVENCKAEGIHSMLQLLSCGEAVVLVDGVEVVDCGRGFSLQNSTNIIRNTKVKAASYGVRLEGGVAETTIKNSTIAAEQPVIVRKVTEAGYVLNVDEASKLVAGGLYQVVFTKGADDAAYVAPAVDFTFNGPADLLVFPLEIVADNAETFADALKANNENVNVVLANDLEVAISSLGQQTGGSGEYKLGGENTKNITIDLNGKKLNITTTYWSNLGAKNNDAVFTIKNGTMTSSQSTGTWNSYDLTFSNCNYVIEDVDFEKAIAFANTGKSASLKNVTISETHDYYAMWICAEGMNVTADNLTIESAGRGIKIDEQYSNDAVAKVTLNVKNSTFTTANKAAILVKSVAGAEINVENINIANVAADNKFAVWVDEDAAAHADKVVVNGALVKVEGANTQAAATDTELREALKNGDDVILTEDITTTDAESNGNGATGININGGVFDGNGHTIAVEGATSTWDSAIAIKGGTIKNVTVAKGFRGIFFKKGTEKIVLDNVIINGPTYTISCDSAGNQGFEAYNSKFFGWTSYAKTIGTGYFEGCTFGAGAGYNYSRPYAPTTYVNCDFEAGHKIDARAVVTFENCRIAGQPLTADNLSTLVTSNIANASVK